MATGLEQVRKIVESYRREYRQQKSGNSARDDCFEAFGDEIERHPIGAGRHGIGGSNLDESDLAELTERRED